MKEDSCKPLYLNLIKEMQSEPSRQSRAQPNPEPSTLSDLYKHMYQNIETFLELKKQEVQDHSQTTKGSPTGLSPMKESCKFSLHSSKLSCPIHDDQGFGYFCRQDQEFVCDYCLEERHQDHDLEDLSQRCRELQDQFTTNLESTSQTINYVQVKKSTIKSGKHIDQFFDSIIQEILQVHMKVKEEQRQKLEENEIQQKFEKHCKKQENKFKQQNDEISVFLDQERYAEAYTNLEYYEDQLREMDKLKQNLSVYENLLLSETQQLTSNKEELGKLKNQITEIIQEYVEKEMKSK